MKGELRLLLSFAVDVAVVVVIVVVVGGCYATSFGCNER